MTRLPPLVPGLADDLPRENSCDCCEGIEVATPTVPLNRPGLSSVFYRPGRHADFVASQEARLTDGASPALAKLQARDTDDFSIALIDAWSCVCDVLSFYQERVANEAWLTTARERESVVELGRLIGYRPRPGVAAATSLVFTLDDPPGGKPHVSAVTIPVGTRVQSVPGPGEKAQTFETVEPIEARVQWNALSPRTSRMILPADGQAGTWLKGISTGLKVGDAILIVGSERGVAGSGAERWDFRFLTAVEPDAEADRTWIRFTHVLGSIDPPSSTAQVDPKLFALRARASLFGANAPHPSLLSDPVLARYKGKYKEPNGDWVFDIDVDKRQIYLDAIQAAFVENSWIALTRPDQIVEAYLIEAATDDGRADYAVSARVSRLTLDSGENLDWFEGAYRQTSVYGASELLPFASSPIPEPVTGAIIELAGLIDDPGKGRPLIVRGRRAVVKVLQSRLSINPKDGGPGRALDAGQIYVLMSAPEKTASGSDASIWTLRAPDGLVGTVVATDAAFAHVAAGQDVEIIAERAALEKLDQADETHSQLHLASALKQAFDRSTTLVHANVAPATHGEATHEILGGGKAGSAFQTFKLKQAPLTYVSAATKSGGESTLLVRVDDLAWAEVPSLYGHGPGERVYETREAEDGSAIIQFGDGKTGARLPTGRNNIVARYRKGIGVAGSVRSETLTTLLDQPLGVKNVTNPLAAGGGQDPETLETARENAPVTVLTLGRVVSLQNYEDYARGFSGVSKAKADLLWDGETRRIVVSVAGPDGASIDENSGTVFTNLVSAFAKFGDPFVRATLVPYRPATFRIRARVRTDPKRDRALVLSNVEKQLRLEWSFRRRGFARVIASSAIMAAMHAVEGVVAVDLDELYRASGPQSTVMLHNRLLAREAQFANDGTVVGAEVLTLDPAPLELGSMG